MNTNKYNELTDSELSKKNKEQRTLMILFCIVLLGLTYFNIVEFIKEDAVKTPDIIIEICTLGGLLIVFGEYQKIQKEIKSRNQVKHN